MTKTSAVTGERNPVREQMERLFAPDIRVRVDSRGVIQGYHSATLQGASFLLKQSLLGMDCDNALALSNGLCFETTEQA